MGITKTPEYKDLRRIVSRAIKEGILKKPKRCSNCKLKAKKINAHHPDYSKPFEVVWLCQGCHSELHARLGGCKKKPPSKPYNPDKRRTLLVNGKTKLLDKVITQENETLGIFFQVGIKDDHEYFREQIGWNKLFKKLMYREKEVIKMRYGIADDWQFTEPRLSLEQIGRVFRVTKERVRQLEAKALRKLQHQMKKV